MHPPLFSRSNHLGTCLFLVICKPLSYADTGSIQPIVCSMRILAPIRIRIRPPHNLRFIAKDIFQLLTE